jgi:prepilin-type processing-associated H-X9-DG protein
MTEVVKTARTSVMAVWSLILGILSMTCMGLFAGLPAIICGHVSISRIKHSDGELEGTGLSIGGLVTGYIGTFITSLAVLGFLAGMLIPAISSARERARRTQCMNHLKMIGMSASTYADSHGGKLPKDMATLAKAQSLQKATLTCRSAIDKAALADPMDDGFGYVIVPGLSESSPANSVLAFDKLNNHRGRGGNVLFLDGSVQWLNKTAFDALIAALPPPGN